MKHKYFIDAHKATTGLFILCLMAFYGVWEDGRAWLYWGMHGTYGLLWILKSQIFPDKQWERKVGLAYGLITFIGLSAYWISPWLIITHRTASPPAWFFGGGVFLYTTGIFLHYVSDMQKHLSLQLRPGSLITDGLWSRVRNPNYLGELLIYCGFGMVAYHWLPFVILGGMVAAMWIPNMLRKDKSLSRYREFSQYKTRTKLFIPFIL